MCDLLSLPLPQWTVNKRSLVGQLASIGGKKEDAGCWILVPLSPPGSSSRGQTCTPSAIVEAQPTLPISVPFLFKVLYYYSFSYISFSVFFSCSYFFLFFKKDTYYARWRLNRVLLVFSALSHRVRVQLILFLVSSPRSWFLGIRARGLFASSTCPMSHLRLARHSIPMLTRKSLTPLSDSLVLLA